MMPDEALPGEATRPRSKPPRAETLLAWYDRHARRLPWRAPPGTASQDPYLVWLSEIMLQQTRVDTVQPYFLRFAERWPTVEALAAAEIDQVLTEWAGLGYYARARSLHACARVVAERHGGVFPRTEDQLRDLPGIGPYTSAAIAAIAFDLPATVVDGNVERVVARIFAVETPLPRAKNELRDVAATLTPQLRAGDFAQAMMDLGATICTPVKPKCVLCPWNQACIARRREIQEELPRREARKPNPTRRGVAYWLVDQGGAVLLRKRAEKGLLGSMIEVPSSEWIVGAPPDVPDGAPAPAEWRRVPGLVRHQFTHFDLELTVLAATVKARNADGLWTLPDNFGDVALPTVMRKVVQHAMRHTHDRHASESGDPGFETMPIFGVAESPRSPLARGRRKKP
jgi:A/G-specific adenine glycosylase